MKRRPHPIRPRKRSVSQAGYLAARYYNNAKDASKSLEFALDSSRARRYTIRRLWRLADLGISYRFLDLCIRQKLNPQLIAAVTVTPTDDAVEWLEMLLHFAAPQKPTAPQLSNLIETLNAAALVFPPHPKRQKRKDIVSLLTLRPLSRTQKVGKKMLFTFDQINDLLAALVDYTKNTKAEQKETKIKTDETPLYDWIVYAAVQCKANTFNAADVVHWTKIYAKTLTDCKHPLANSPLVDLDLTKEEIEWFIADKALRKFIVAVDPFLHESTRVAYNEQQTFAPDVQAMLEKRRYKTAWEDVLKEYKNLADTQKEMIRIVLTPPYTLSWDEVVHTAKALCES